MKLLLLLSLVFALAASGYLATKRSVLRSCLAGGMASWSPDPTPALVPLEENPIDPALTSAVIELALEEADLRLRIAAGERSDGETSLQERLDVVVAQRQLHYRNAFQGDE